MPTLEELDAQNELLASAETTPVVAAPGESPPLSLEELDAQNELLAEPSELAQPTAPSGPPPGQVLLYDPDGRAGYAPEGDAFELTERYGYQTAEQRQAAALEAEYGGGAQGALARSEAWARGATAGLSDVAGNLGAGLVGAAMDEIPRTTEQGVAAPLDTTSEFSREYKQAAEDQAGRRAALGAEGAAWEIAGAVAPALLSGGAGAAGVAARMTPAGRLANLSTKFATALGKKVPSLATTTAGRIAANALVGGVTGSAENAARVFTEDLAAGNLDATADRMVGALWDGLVLGGGIGAGLSGLVEGGSAAAKAVAGKIPSLRDLAGESAYKAVMGRTSKAAVKAAERHGGAAEVGKTLLDEGIPVTGGAGEIFDALDSRATEVGRELGGKVDEITRLSGGRGPNRAGLWKRIDDDVIAPLRDSPINKDLADKLENEFASLKKALNPPKLARDGSGKIRSAAPETQLIGFDELNQMRKELDQRINWDKFAPDASLEARKRVRNAIEDYWIKAADEAAESSGVTGFADDVRALKQRYARLALARDQAEERVVSELANRSTSLTDTLVGAATGAGAGDPITGYLASQMHKVIRERGRGYVAVGLDRISRVVSDLGKGAVATEQAAQKAANNTVKNMIFGKLEQASGDGAAKATSVAPALTTVAIRRAIEQAIELSDPGSTSSRALQSHIDALSEESPELAQALEARVRAKAAMIAEAAGPQADTSDPFVTRPPRRDSVTERKAMRLIDAVRRPEKALERLGDGVGTPEDLQVMKTLYPSIYQQYVERVWSEVGRAKVPPSHRARQLLYKATGVASSRELSPDYIAARQVDTAEDVQSRSEADDAQPVVTPGNAKFETDADSRFASRTDAIMTEHYD